MDEPFIGCSIRELPAEQLLAAARSAIEMNPANAVPAAALAQILTEPVEPIHLAMLAGKYWGVGGVKLGVRFLDDAPADLQRRILSHANAWGEWGNVEFFLTADSAAPVRIARSEQAYYCYLGNDLLQVPLNQHTMMLGGFTMQTRDSEFFRVVRHEFGHALAFPHVHQLKEIVEQILVDPAYAYFWETQRWRPRDVDQQVLRWIPVEQLAGPTVADRRSLMAYWLPGKIMRDGRDVPGGADISEQDKLFVAKVYPKAIVTPPPPPPPPPVTPPDPGLPPWLLAIVELLKRLLGRQPTSGEIAEAARAFGRQEERIC